MTTFKFGRRMLASTLLVGVCFSGAAQASTQGSLGATSTGSVSINASVPNRVQITALNDVSFSSVDPTSNASNAQNVCVWSNTSTKGYTITASGSGTASAFTLASGALAPVPYTVQWSQSTGQTTGTSLTKSVALTGQVSTATRPTCNSGPATTASLVVGIAATDLQNMVSNTSYAGTLTLLVAPE